MWFNWFCFLNLTTIISQHVLLCFSYVWRQYTKGCTLASLSDPEGSDKASVFDGLEIRTGFKIPFKIKVQMVMTLFYCIHWLVLLFVTLLHLWQGGIVTGSNNSFSEHTNMWVFIMLDRLWKSKSIPLLWTLSSQPPYVWTWQHM